jgi:phage repressor protein C with HTH and peptisase S24 domain
VLPRLKHIVLPKTTQTVYNTECFKCNNFNMNLIAELEQHRKRNGLQKSDMAGLFGVPDQNYNNWVYRGSLPKDRYQSALKILGKGITQGKSVSEPTEKHMLGDDDTYVEIPFKSISLHASIDGYEIQFGDDETIKPLFYRRDWIQNKGYRVGALVAREIKGSSMEPSLWEGDKVLINTDSKLPKIGRVFWVVLDGNSCAKRLRKDAAGGWVITSDNPAHHNTNQPLENTQQLIGEVVEKMSSQI